MSMMQLTRMISAIQMTQCACSGSGSVILLEPSSFPTVICLFQPEEDTKFCIAVTNKFCTRSHCSTFTFFPIYCLLLHFQLCLVTNGKEYYLKEVHDKHHIFTCDTNFHLQERHSHCENHPDVYPLNIGGGQDGLGDTDEAVRKLSWIVSSASGVQMNSFSAWVLK